MSQVDTANPAVEPVEAFTKLEQNGAALMPLRKAGLARFSESGYSTLAVHQRQADRRTAVSTND